MSQFSPLFAWDMGSVLSFVVFAIVVLASVVSQFLAKQREQQQGGRRPERGPREVGPMDEMQGGGRQRGRPQAQKPAALEDEIGEFLRRAAKGGGQQRPAQQARPAQAGLPPRPVQARPKQSRPARPRAPVPRRAQPPLAAEIVEPTRPPLGQGLGQQVARDISTADIARRAGELGQKTRQTAAKLDRQIHETFDHQVGTLQRRSNASSAEPKAARESTLPITSAAGLVAILSDAESLKQAIILNEILQRPAHRW